MIQLTKEMIDKAFTAVHHQHDVAVNLYRIAFPNWEKIKAIDDYPRVSKETNKYIFEKFIEFDKKYHPDVINGGFWIDKGFSSIKPSQEDWTIDLSTCKITYHENKQTTEKK